MEFTPKLKEKIIDKLEQILESIKIIKERCKDYLSVAIARNSRNCKARFSKINPPPLG